MLIIIYHYFILEKFSLYGREDLNPERSIVLLLLELYAFICRLLQHYSLAHLLRKWRHVIEKKMTRLWFSKSCCVLLFTALPLVTLIIRIFEMRCFHREYVKFFYRPKSNALKDRKLASGEVVGREKL